MCEKSVLVVDDCKIWCEALEIMFQEKFPHVDFNYVLNKDELIEFLNKKNPDCILLDFHYEKQKYDGSDLFELIKGINQKIKICFTSRYDPLVTKNLNHDGFIEKSSDFEECYIPSLKKCLKL